MKIRPAVPADADAIAEVCNALSRALYGDPDVTAGEIRHWFTFPNVELFVGAEDGAIAAYLDLTFEESGTGEAYARVQPHAWGRGLADALLAYAEHRARRRPGIARLRTSAAEPDAELREAADRRGYRPIRHSFTMEIELARAPEVVVPEGFALDAYQHPAEEERVHEAQMDAFADHWDFHPIPIDRWRTYLTNRDNFDPTLWIVARADSELAGVALNSWHPSGDPQAGWVNALGVRPAWRRRGLGEALLRATFAKFAERGATKVGLWVDAQNPTGAVRLYERAGMRTVRRSDTYEKAL
jgi:mycothiol synthase